VVRGVFGEGERYPSTEAVIEAVATGKAKAGYVISTRCSLAAHESWPRQGCVSSRRRVRSIISRSPRPCGNQTAS